jgi:hypothetical protein
VISGRRLDWPDCRNVRDLGGLPRPGGVTRGSVFVRSDCTANLTPQGQEAMRAFGVALVIDLRTSAELKRAPSPLSPRPIGERARVRGVIQHRAPAYVNLPLIDDALMARLDHAPDMLGRYLMMVEDSRPAMRAIFERLATAEGATLVHCFAGKDRTGIVAAMMLELAGVPRESIAADFAESEAQLADRFEEWVAAAAPERREIVRDDLRCPPDRILGLLDHLDSRWGGVAGYLDAAGVAPARIDRLGSMLA